MSEIRGKTTATIAASPDEVFAKITDMNGLPSWNSAMTRVCEQPARLETGAEWVVEFHVLGRTWLSRSRCEAIDPTARRFVYRSCTDDGNPSHAQWEWNVTPAEQGSRVEVAWQLHPVTFWRRVLLGKIRARQLAHGEVAASLAELGRVLGGVRPAT
jgi:uncharacterized protein YndB with AHSA1/START domain